MFNLIKAYFARRSSVYDQWCTLCDAGYRDAPASISRRHARESAERERLGLHSMGHLR